MTTTTHKLSPEKEAREHLKAQLAEYLAEQPESILQTHKWMKRAEAAGLGIVIAAFAVALYGSFTWAGANPTMIPVAWFGFATCLSLMMILNGLHAILIHAYPTAILPGKVQKFVSGSGAMWTGAAFIVGGLFMAGLWITFAYSTATFNLAMLVPLMNIFGFVMGIGVVVSIVFTIYQKVSQSH